MFCLIGRCSDFFYYIVIYLDISSESALQYLLTAGAVMPQPSPGSEFLQSEADKEGRDS